MNDPKKTADKAPAPALSGETARELERKLKRNPKDAGLRADVGSDESMDASDPSSATQPGRSDEPAPSSGFPENNCEKK